MYIRNPLTVQLDRTSLAESYQQALAANKGQPLADEALRTLALAALTEAVARELRAMQASQFAGPSDAQREANAKAFYTFYAPRGKTIIQKQPDGVTVKQRPPLQQFKVRLVDLPAFCKQMGLDARKLTAVGEGAEKEHRGWQQGPFSGNPVERQYQRGACYKAPIDYSDYTEAVQPGEIRSPLPIVRELDTWGVQAIDWDANAPDAPSANGWQFGQVIVSAPNATPKTAGTPLDAGDVFAKPE